MPTAPGHYTIAEVEATEKLADPPSWPLNAQLGRFTNFVNLLDMCGVSVPSGLLRCPPLDPQDPDSKPPPQPQHFIEAEATSNGWPAAGHRIAKQVCRRLHHSRELMSG